MEMEFGWNGRLKCVSKLWNTLISDPHFAESHLHLSAAPTHVCLFISGNSKACSVDIDAAFHDYNCATAAKERACSLTPSTAFFVAWNPVTGSSKRVSYSHIASRSNPVTPSLYGFGYDASQDDYLVVVASQDKNGQDHFDCLSLRTNSSTNLDFALSKPLGRSSWESRGFFLNGAIHWSSCTLRVRDYSILIFDLKERCFSTISMPEQVMGYLNPTHLGLLGGCLALYSYGCDKTNIWVMKEYKVHSSWTFYPILVVVNSLRLYAYPMAIRIRRTMSNKERELGANDSTETLSYVVNKVLASSARSSF
ncbi:F-box protein CPR1-like [Arachis stenosperma]|uniref:F-box protein CPR1-like n=1 Tax=Arachis stenosperma TaxID=217475 RepID=UPI0025AC9D84|nr:F-box protein CPR1-like [Arachis stenosperma]